MCRRICCAVNVFFFLKTYTITIFLKEEYKYDIFLAGVIKYKKCNNNSRLYSS